MARRLVPRTRNVGLVRVLRLLRILQEEGPRTVLGLAERLRVDKRTVWRDFRVLEEAGFQILYRRDKPSEPAAYYVVGRNDERASA